MFDEDVGGDNGDNRVPLIVLRIDMVLHAAVPVVQGRVVTQWRMLPKVRKKGSLLFRGKFGETWLAFYLHPDER
jgi:hypothetical protein